MKNNNLSKSKLFIAELGLYFDQEIQTIYNGKIKLIDLLELYEKELSKSKINK